MHHHEGPVQVRVDDRAPALFGEIQRSLGKLSTGVVDDDVEAAPRGLDPREERIDLIGLPDVGRLLEMGRSDPVEQARRSRELLRITAAEDEACAEAAEEAGDGAADAGSGAGDEDHSIGEEAVAEDGRPREQGLVLVVRVVAQSRRIP